MSVEAMKQAREVIKLVYQRAATDEIRGLSDAEMNALATDKAVPSDVRQEAEEVLRVRLALAALDFSIGQAEQAQPQGEVVVEGAVPPKVPPTDEQRDAVRYRWLKSRMMGADFDWNESGASALVFEWPKDVQVGADCDKNIDNAIYAESEGNAASRE